MLCIDPYQHSAFSLKPWSPATTCHPPQVDEVQKSEAAEPHPQAEEQDLKHVFDGDGDEALRAYADLGGVAPEVDEATNKRLLRRIDWNLMPVGTQSLYLIPGVY